jgi:hypothetical protein
MGPPFFTLNFKLQTNEAGADIICLADLNQDGMLDVLDIVMMVDIIISA